MDNPTSKLNFVGLSKVTQIKWVLSPTGSVRQTRGLPDDLSLDAGLSTNHPVAKILNE